VENSPRPSFYALPRGAWRDYVTLLHLPYTAWLMGYVVLGSATAPVVHLDRVGWVTLAFFLAVGIGAHALDEYRGRPFHTSISDRLLLVIGVAGIAGAIAVGVHASLVVSPWAAPFVVFGGFIVIAYNMEWFGGWFHNGLWFALAWGAFPPLAGYWANAKRLDPEAFAVAAACFVLSIAQRTLSLQAKRLRRGSATVSGEIRLDDGTVEKITISSLVSAPEMALGAMSAAVVLLSVGWLVARV
jgi:hypothetical protein